MHYVKWKETHSLRYKYRERDQVYTIVVFAMLNFLFTRNSVENLSSCLLFLNILF